MLSRSRILCLQDTSQAFNIYRYDPNGRGKPYMEGFTINMKECGPMIVDALIKIKSESDSSLSFRRSCREGVCGSCSMNVDGFNVLACVTFIKPSIAPIEIRPLPNSAVMKDLVPDLSNFYSAHKSVEPWLHRTDIRPWTQGEIRQSREERRKLDGLYECILCACCTTACPPYWWNMESYLGPAALLQAYRWISDSRDQMRKERVAWLNDSMRLFRCHGIGNCTACCPKNLDPASAIEKIKSLVSQDGKHVQQEFREVAHLGSEHSGLSMN
jgi:succinate dehydrogenase (ubiquinone) iron-sulfur subunit